MPTPPNDQSESQVENDFLEIELELEEKEKENPSQENPSQPPQQPSNQSAEQPQTENPATEQPKEEVKPEEEKKTEETPPATPPNNEEDDDSEIDTNLVTDNQTPNETTTETTAEAEEIVVPDSEVKRENQDLRIENTTLSRNLKVNEDLLAKAEKTINDLEALVRRYLPFISGKENVVIDVNGEKRPFSINKIISEADEQAIATLSNKFRTDKQQGTYQTRRCEAEATLSKTLGSVVYELKGEGLPAKGLKQAVLEFQNTYSKDNQFALEWIKKVVTYESDDLALRVKSVLKKSVEDKTPKKEVESELEKLRRENAELKAKQTPTPQEPKKVEQTTETPEVKPTENGEADEAESLLA